MADTPIRVAIVEDLPDVLDFLTDVFKDDRRFVLERFYTNAEDAVLFMPKTGIDVAIVDIGLPGMNGIACLNQLIPQMQDTQFMMYTVFDEDDKVFESLKAGASGYLLKSATTARVLDAVAELHHGGAPMSPLIARKVTAYFSGRRTQTSLTVLSAREGELLEYLARGYLYKEIGDSLGIRTGTVKQHIHRIYRKLHVQNRTEATNLFFGRI